MKFKPSEQLAHLLGDLLADTLPHLFEHTRWDLIVPMPSSREGFSKRLFNPCDIMARCIGRRYGIPVQAILGRNQTRKPQSQKSHAERLGGLRGLFTVKPGLRPQQTSILLVEDVITTGATVAAASKTLLQPGIGSVDIISVARTRVWNRFRGKIYTALFDSERPC